MDANEYLLTRKINDGDTCATVMEEYHQMKSKEEQQASEECVNPEDVCIRYGDPFSTCDGCGYSRPNTLPIRDGRINEVFDKHCGDDGYMLMKRSDFKAALQELEVTTKTD
jgi:hypothetical protein